MDRFMCYYFVRKFDSREQERSTGVKQRRGGLRYGSVINWLLPSVTNYLTLQNSPLKSCVNNILATFIQRELGKNLPMNSTSYWSRFHPLGALICLYFWAASVQAQGRVLRCSTLQCQQDTQSKSCVAGTKSRTPSGCACVKSGGVMLIWKLQCQMRQERGEARVV